MNIKEQLTELVARLKAHEPKEFERAVQWEGRLQAAMKQVGGFYGTPWLHRSCKPLSEVDFSTPEETPMFGAFTEECEGMCGV